MIWTGYGHPIDFQNPIALADSGAIGLKMSSFFNWSDIDMRRNGNGVRFKSEERYDFDEIIEQGKWKRLINAYAETRKSNRSFTYRSAWLDTGNKNWMVAGHRKPISVDLLRHQHAPFDQRRSLGWVMRRQCWKLIFNQQKTIWLLQPESPPTTSLWRCVTFRWPVVGTP